MWRKKYSLHPLDFLLVTHFLHYFQPQIFCLWRGAPSTIFSLVLRLSNGYLKADIRNQFLEQFFDLDMIIDLNFF